MRPNSEVLSKLSLIKEGIQEKYPVSAIAIFGSFARGEQNPGSDIDILVEINGKIGSRFIDLAEELEEKLGYPVDLVSKNGIKPQYLHAIEPDLVYV